MTATITSTGELEKMSAPALVKFYNSLNPPKPVTRFSDKETAVRRCLVLLAAQQGGPKTSPPPSAPVAPVLPAKPARTVETTSTSPRRVQFDVPPKDKIKGHRENTKRARVIQMLSRPGGATFEEVMDAIGWDRRTTYEGIKLLHSHVGYGLREDALTHKIRLVKS